jgi:integrase
VALDGRAHGIAVGQVDVGNAATEMTAGRHTHATLLLAAGEPVKVVSERLGHANATITLTVYQHVHPGMGRQAADRFAALVDG